MLSERKLIRVHKNYIFLFTKWNSFLKRTPWLWPNILEILFSIGETIIPSIHSSKKEMKYSKIAHWSDYWWLKKKKILLVLWIFPEHLDIFSNIKEGKSKKTKNNKFISIWSSCKQIRWNSIFDSIFFGKLNKRTQVLIYAQIEKFIVIESFIP